LVPTGTISNVILKECTRSISEGHLCAVRAHLGPNLHAHFVELALFLLDQEADWQLIALVPCLVPCSHVGECHGTLVVGEPSHRFGVEVVGIRQYLIVVRRPRVKTLPLAHLSGYAVRRLDLVPIRVN